MYVNTNSHTSGSGPPPSCQVYIDKHKQGVTNGQKELFPNIPKRDLAFLSK